MRNIFFIFLLVPSFFSCKKDQTKSEEKDVLSGNAGSIGLARGIKAEVLAADQLFTSLWQSPYAVNLAEMPTHGEVPEALRPRSGSWYPYASGGTNDDQALVQYDQEYKSEASSWEAQNHQTSRENLNENNSWFGHCNGYSAASLRHLEPQKDVKTPSGTVFTRMQIKALLAEIYMDAERSVIGGQRCERAKQEIKQGPSVRVGDPETLGLCEDISPASLHLALANWVAKAGYGFVADVSDDNQVWNYPVVAYKCLNCASGKAVDWIEISKTAAYSLINVDKDSKTFKFPEAARRFFDIQIELSLTLGKEKESLGDSSVKPYKLAYLLLTDENYNIVGGEWQNLYQNGNQHPDFIWIPFHPSPVAAARNPQVDPEKVLELWRQSVEPSKELESRLLVKPPIQTTWGIKDGYRISLDNRRTGSVFLGKPIHLSLDTPADSSFRGKVFSIEQDSEVLFKELTAVDIGVSVFLKLNSPGLHFLKIKWAASGTIDQFPFLAVD